MGRLQDLASVLRSKNAGPFQVTIDVMFPDAATYRRVLESNALTPQTVGTLYNIDRALVSVVPFDRVCAIKVTIPRRSGTRGSGSSFDRDVYGAQQHGPLVDIEIP